MFQKVLECIRRFRNIAAEEEWVPLEEQDLVYISGRYGFIVPLPELGQEIFGAVVRKRRRDKTQVWMKRTQPTVGPWQKAELERLQKLPGRDVIAEVWMRLRH